MKQKAISLLIVLGISFVSCVDNEEYIPSLAVYLELDMKFEDKVLRDKLGYKAYIQENAGKDFIAGKEFVGYGGVLVINTISEGYRAFDLACAEEAVSSIRVQVDDNGLYATCPVCGTIYEVGDNGTGWATNSANPKLHLRRYTVTERGNGELIVTNSR